MEQTIMSPKSGTGYGGVGDVEERSVVATVVSTLAVAWQKIRAGFWSVENKLSSNVTRPLDIERISAQLAVLKRAQEEGRQDLPPPGEETPSGTQREIIAHFSNLRRRARGQAATTVEKSRAVLEKLQKSDGRTMLKDVPAGCENKILRHVADVETRLNNTVEREQNQKQYYDTFRKKNGLDRVAQYSANSYRYLVIVPALVLTIAFALASIAGPLSGANPGVSMAWIAVVSLAAVLVPFMFGDSLLRWINHVGAFRSFIGLVGTGVALATIAAMAYYTDFHIASVLANPDVSNRDVLETILAGPRDIISGIENWRGFGLVALAGLLAMLLAYRSDDPYPGYGAVQRSYFGARGARDDAFAKLRGRINNLVDASEAEIAGISKDFKTRVRSYARLVEKSERDPSVLTEYDAELEDACNIVLDRYRGANLAVRKSETPLSFSEHVCFNPDSEMDSRLHNDGRSHVADLQSEIAELDKEAELARQRLRDLNLRMINSVTEAPSFDDESTA